MPHKTSVDALAFSGFLAGRANPDGGQASDRLFARWPASGTGGSNAQEAVKLWDLATRRELLSLQAEGELSLHVAFSVSFRQGISLYEQVIYAAQGRLFRDSCSLARRFPRFAL
jgi:hypothetical protein